MFVMVDKVLIVIGPEFEDIEVLYPYYRGLGFMLVDVV